MEINNQPINYANKYLRSIRVQLTALISKYVFILC